MWGNIWRLLVVVFMIRSIKPGRLASVLWLWLSIPTNSLDDCFSSGRFIGKQKQKQKSSLVSFPLYYCFNRMRNSVAYCCRDFVVNQHKALLANRLPLLCYDSFGCGGFARLFHFKTTFWVNHWCDTFDCRCKWLVCVNSFMCITLNRWHFCSLNKSEFQSQCNELLTCIPLFERMFPHNSIFAHAHLKTSLFRLIFAHGGKQLWRCHRCIRWLRVLYVDGEWRKKHITMWGESKREPSLMVSDARDCSQVLVWLEASVSWSAYITITRWPRSVI